MYCMEMSLTTVPAPRALVLSTSVAASTDLIGMSVGPRVYMLLGFQEHVLISFKIRR